MAAARVTLDGRHLPHTLPRGVEIVMEIEEVEPVPGTDCSFQAHCRATSRRVASWPQQVDALHRALAFALHALSAPDSGSRHAASHSGGVSVLARTPIARGPAIATRQPTCKRQGGNLRMMLDAIGLIPLTPPCVQQPGALMAPKRHHRPSTLLYPMWSHVSQEHPRERDYHALPSPYNLT